MFPLIWLTGAVKQPMANRGFREDAWQLKGTAQDGVDIVGERRPVLWIRERIGNERTVDGNLIKRVVKGNDTLNFGCILRRGYDHPGRTDVEFFTILQLYARSDRTIRDIVKPAMVIREIVVTDLLQAGANGRACAALPSENQQRSAGSLVDEATQLELRIKGDAHEFVAQKFGQGRPARDGFGGWVQNEFFARMIGRDPVFVAKVLVGVQYSCELATDGFGIDDMSRPLDVGIQVGDLSQWIVATVVRK